MKRPSRNTAIAAVTLIAVAVATSVWIAFTLQAKQKYDKLRDKLNSELPQVFAVEMDAYSMTLVAEARANWVKRYDQVGGPWSVALKRAGLQPTVKGIVDLYTYRMPEYSFLSAEHNKKALEMGAIQVTMSTFTTDQSIHVSEDGSLALVCVFPNLVCVFSDEANGLREAAYATMESTQSGRNKRENQTP